MKKPTAADIAAKYQREKKYPWTVCDLGPERAALVRALRKEHALSYRSVADAIAGEFKVPVKEGAVRAHFLNHEKAA